MSRIEQYALDLGEGPRIVALDSKTGRPLDADGKPMPMRSRPLTATQLRNVAIQRVMDNERHAWHELHDKELIAFLHEKGTKPFIAEDFRRWFMARGNAAPHHPNVWGATWMSASRQDLIMKTGRWRSPQDAPSHARPTSEWMRHMEATV
jgi:hypothetical protein